MLFAAVVLFAAHSGPQPAGWALVGGLALMPSGVVVLYRAWRMRAALSRSPWRVYRATMKQVVFGLRGSRTIFALLHADGTAGVALLGTLGSCWAWRSDALQRQDTVWVVPSGHGHLVLAAPGPRNLFYASRPSSDRQARQWRSQLGVD